MSDGKPTTGRKKRRKNFEARSVSEIIGKVLEPVMARRSGMTLDLIKAWPEIAGVEFRDTTRPEKIDWPRRAHEEDPFEPATLVVACENSAALFFQHEQAAILERVNMFFGFEAIKRIRILQKPVLPPKETKKLKKSISTEDEARLASILDEIIDPDLKEVLEKLGRGIISKQS